jgi:FtsH-binding integral membrane protein
MNRWVNLIWIFIFIILFFVIVRSTRRNDSKTVITIIILLVFGAWLIALFNTNSKLNFLLAIVFTLILLVWIVYAILDIFLVDPNCPSVKVSVLTRSSQHPEQS